MQPQTAAALAQQRPRVFYGWYIVIVAFLGFFISAGISTYAFGVLIKPIWHGMK